MVAERVVFNPTLEKVSEDALLSIHVGVLQKVEAGANNLADGLDCSAMITSDLNLRKVNTHSIVQVNFEVWRKEEYYRHLLCWGF